MSSRKPRTRLNEMTQEIYQSVIDETVGSIKSQFVEQGVSEDVLRELRALWENNVSKSGAIGEYVGAVKTEEAAVLSLANPVAPDVEQGSELVRRVKNDDFVKAEDRTEDRTEDRAEDRADEPVEPATAKTEQTDDSSKRPLDSESFEGCVANPVKKMRQEDVDVTGDAGDAEDELLGSDLDDSEIGELDDVGGQDATGQVDENNSANMVLGAFTKVSRSKNRWRVVLNGCVASVSGKDFLFKKLGLDLEWA